MQDQSQYGREYRKEGWKKGKEGEKEEGLEGENNSQIVLEQDNF